MNNKDPFHILAAWLVIWINMNDSLLSLVGKALVEVTFIRLEADVN